MCLRILDEEKPIAALTHEDMMSLRHELLTGYQLIGKTLEQSHKKEELYEQSMGIWL